MPAGLAWKPASFYLPTADWGEQSDPGLEKPYISEENESLKCVCGCRKAKKRNRVWSKEKQRNFSRFILQISHHTQVSWAEKLGANYFVFSQYWSQKQLDPDIQWFVRDPCLYSYGATTSAACAQFWTFCCQMENVEWKEFREQWQSH